MKAKQDRLATVQPIIRDIITKGKVETLKGISEALNARGITTPRNAQWSITQVRRAIGGVKVSEFAKAA